MIELLDSVDKQAFQYLNGLHSPFWDGVMIIVTGKLVWIPFYVFLLYLLLRSQKKKSLYYVLAIPLLIIWADRIASGVFKPGIERLRPCYETTLGFIVHQPNGCGGQFGFFSSHASNAFAIASFLFFVFRKDYKYGWLLFVWAVIVSYSRVYLGVHYPGDVLTGAAFGTLSGYLFFILATKARKKWAKAY